MTTRARWETVRAVLSRALVWAVLLALWEAAFRVIGWKEWIFPAPSHVARALVALVDAQSDHALQEALIVSGARLVVGFAASIALGVSVGTAMWRWRWLDELLGGALLGLQTLPSVCWVPLGILVFGLNERGIAFVLVMGSAFAIAIAFRDGLRTIPPIYMKAGLMLGAHGTKLYRHVILPASMPSLASSLRQGFSFAWRSLMGAELIFMVRGHGVGYLLHQGREFSDIAQVVAVMAVMVGVGMVFDRTAFAPLERRVHRRFGLAQAT